MKANDDMVAEIAKLRAMDVPALVAKYTELFGKPPRVRNREALWKRVSWKLQEQRSGGLSTTAKTKLEALIAEIDLPLDDNQRSVSGVLAPTRAGKSGTPAVGTTITREWHGRQVCLTVVDGGFEVDGTVHKSLSAAAKALTGAHWNGKLFWGLTARKTGK